MNRWGGLDTIIILDTTLIFDEPTIESRIVENCRMPHQQSNLLNDFNLPTTTLSAVLCESEELPIESYGRYATYHYFCPLSNNTISQGTIY